MDRFCGTISIWAATYMCLHSTATARSAEENFGTSGRCGRRCFAARSGGGRPCVSLRSVENHFVRGLVRVRTFSLLGEKREGVDLYPINGVRARRRAVGEPRKKGYRPGPPLGVRLFLKTANLHAPATSRSPHSLRSLSCRFFLCRVALLCLVLRRRCRLPIPCSRGFFPPFGATLPSSRHILAPRVYRALLAQGRLF